MTRLRAALLVALVLAVGGCASSAGAGVSTSVGSGGQLDGTTWVLGSVASGGLLELVPEGLYADASFEGLRVDGFSGCNTYAGLARSGTRSLLISQLASTQMACDDLSMTFESAYLAALEASRFYSARDDRLTIFGAGGQVVLIFDAAPQNPLLGRWIVDSYAQAPGSQAIPISGTQLTAVFSITDVGGFAGCNSYAGVYASNGTLVRVSRLATTRKSCADDVMTQETAFLGALQGSSLIERRGDSMVLRDRSGAVLVAMTNTIGKAVESLEPTPPPIATLPPTPKPTPTPTPKPTTAPTAKPTEAATAKPTEAPNATPTEAATAKPTEAPTAAPTVKPTPEPTPGPTATPPPPTSSCTLTSPSGTQLASVAYPQDWNTVTAPADLACRYFDPEPISVPAEGAPDVAVTIQADVSAFEDAVATAIDPANWNVTQHVETTLSGLQATLVEATSTAPESGTAEGTTLYTYLIDYGGNGTLTIQASGTAGDAAYAAATQAADQIAQLSTFTPPTPTVPTAPSEPAPASSPSP